MAGAIVVTIGATIAMIGAIVAMTGAVKVMIEAILAMISEVESICSRRAWRVVEAENELTLKKCWPALRLRLLGLKMSIFDARVCQSSSPAQ